MGTETLVAVPQPQPVHVVPQFLVDMLGLSAGAVKPARPDGRNQLIAFTEDGWIRRAGKDNKPLRRLTPSQPPRTTTRRSRDAANPRKRGRAPTSTPIAVLS